MLYNIEWCVALRMGMAGWCIAIIYNNVIHVHGFGNSVDGTKSPAQMLHKCTNCRGLAKAVFPQKIASVKKKS